MRQAILEFRIGVLDVGFRFLQFGLREFDDRAETQVIAGFCKVEGEVSLLPELLCDGETFESAAGILPGVANVAGDVVASVQELLSMGFGLEIGSFAACVVEKTIKKWNVDVDADGAVPAFNMIVADGGLPDDAEGVDRGSHRDRVRHCRIFAPTRPGIAEL